MSFLARMRSLWQGARRRDDIDAGIREEFEHHIAMRARDLEHAGTPAAEARRQARLEFGSTGHFREETRASRGLAKLDRIRFSWLDVKLGFRMLARYPGLTLVGGFAIAFAICAGATMFEFITQTISPKLPFAEGDRIVALRLWDAEQSDVEPRIAREFTEWRRSLRTVTDVGAARTVERNVATGDGVGQPVRYAEMTAAGFAVTRVSPILGRPLVAADERPGAPDVVVIGYDTWQQRFGGDSAVLGQRMRLGRATAEVVGVMPKGFAFPAIHDLWAPLRVEEGAWPPREGPSLVVFGRLAPGASMKDARAELSVLAARAAQDYPQTHRHLRGEVKHYPRSLLDVPAIEATAMMSSNLIAIMLLVLICSNVALLMFARAASRENEIAVRTALGASRNRIVTQLFAEALVLGGIAAVIGLVAASRTIDWAYYVLQISIMGSKPGTPFWFDGSLSPATIVYATLLTLLGAAVAGILPALKVTADDASATLKQASAGGRGLRFGGIWTFVIVTQVALTVAFPAVAFMSKKEAVELSSYTAGIRLEEYLTAELDLDPELEAGADTSQAAFVARYAAAMTGLERRLLADPAVAGVTWAGRLPRMTHFPQSIEVQGETAPPLDEEKGHQASPSEVAPNFFDVMGRPVIQGRAFHAGDMHGESGAVIVNESFVRDILGGRPPLGRQLRYISKEEGVEPGPWMEIIGVAPDLGTKDQDGDAAAIYRAVAHGARYPMHVAIRLHGDPLAFVPALRAAGLATDPTLQLEDVLPLTQVITGEYKFIAGRIRIILAVSTVALILSLAGIYAVMSFTVSRRTREIGMRVALGATAQRVILAVFKRPLRQVTAGVVVGCGLAGLIAMAMSDMTLTPRGVLSVVTYGVLMLMVCLLACLVPTRRALAIEPTEALRSE